MALSTLVLLTSTLTCALANHPVFAQAAAPAGSAPSAELCTLPSELIKQLQKESKYQRLASVMLLGLRTDNCSSVRRTVQQLVSSQTFGGRNLHGQDGNKLIADAEAELLIARQDPATKAAVDAELAYEQDATMRQIRQAAVLGSRDYLKAKSLLLYRLSTGTP